VATATPGTDDNATIPAPGDDAEDVADPFRAPTGTPPPGTGPNPPPPPAAAAHGSLRFEPDLHADRPGYVLTPADILLDNVFGDHVHANDGTHLSGGVNDDTTWQKYWKSLVAFSPARYDAPKGRTGKRFISMLADEFQGVVDRHWNSERPIVFAAVILQKQTGVVRAKDIRARLMSRMDIWEQGRYKALVDDTIVQMRMRPTVTGVRDKASEGRAFNAKVLSGRLRSAVRNLTNRESGGVKMPDDLCSKTGTPVLEVLRGKHPALRDPGPEVGRSDTAFEPYDAPAPDTVPVEITADVVEAVASSLSGAAGPGGTDSVTLANWLLRYGEASERLRIAMANLGSWLANGHPPWAAYRALRACRLVALDKEPGTRPVGIGEMYSRLLAKCILQQVGLEATVACGSLNLCAGLKAGIEGAVHAIQSLWDEHPPTAAGENGGGEGGSPTPAQEVTPPSTQDSAMAPLEDDPDDPWGGLLVDAYNGFNELQRKAMLWTVRHLWPSGARMAFNCYRHAAILVLRGKNGHCEFLLSCEGVTQGDPLSMFLYGLALTPLSRNLRDQVPEAVQPVYADDMFIAGTASRIADCMRLLQVQGPRRGYFPEPAKSIVVCRPEHEAALRDKLSEFNFRYEKGHRYIGGFIGSTESKTQWIEEQIEKWVAGVRDLSRVAHRYPQAAYAGLTKSLQTEWTYLQRVVPDLEAHFTAVEQVIVDEFLPALFGEEDGAVLEPLRALFTLPCRLAGLGVPDPRHTSAGNYKDSKSVTTMIAQCLRASKDLDVGTYLERASQETRTNRAVREGMAENRLEAYLETVDAATKRRVKRSQDCGAWLTVMPSQLNGTELSALEFRDALRIRFGLNPQNLPEQCDGCGARFTVDHAMQCRRGGLVIHRHDDVAGEWHQLCASSLTPSKVSDEPLIPQSRVRTEVNGVVHMTDPPAIRGDVAAHGFWQRGTTTIFDIRVTDTDSRSHRNKDPTKVLAKQAKEKKDKYSDACTQARRHFTPLVFSVDGLREKETIAASKRLSRLLSDKWKRPYSQVVGMVRSRLSIALARASSRCLRESRDPSVRNPAIGWIEGTGLRLFR
jgi:hypothetical protein